MSKIIQYPTWKNDKYQLVNCTVIKTSFNDIEKSSTLPLLSHKRYISAP